MASLNGLELYSSFWINLHHRLHADARDQKRRVDPAGLPAGERQAWEAALAYYSVHLARHDLRTGRGMTAISEALSRESASLEGAEMTPEHRTALEAAAPVYRRVRWPADDAANRRWIADVAPRLTQVAIVVLPRLAEFYRQPWYDASAPIRVDIVTVGAARGGYTWLRPRVHTVIDAAEPNYQAWLGLEMLLHEASHGLTARLEEAIGASAAKAGKKDSGQLWHPLQFYVVGEVLRRVLVEQGVSFTSYLYATGLFDRAWGRFRPAVEEEMTSYLDGRRPLDEAIARIVARVAP